MRKTIAVIFAVGALASATLHTDASAQQAPSIELGAPPLPHQFPPAPPANETAAQRQARWQAWHDANPNIDAEIAAFVQTSSAQSAAYRAQLDMLRARLSADPFAEIARQSARLTSAQRQEALGIFSNAFALWQAGQFDAAEVLFVRGLDLDPANAPANYYLGDILKRKNDNDRAAEHMRRTVALAPNSQQAALAEVALRTLPAASTEPETIRTAPPAIFDAANRPIALWDCASCPEMVVLPAGSFTVGQERVTLETPIAVSRFEVMFDEWGACAQAGGCRSNRSPSDQGWGRQRRPALSVSSHDTREFVDWLSQHTAHSYRLLTDVEWKYAAGAGTSTTDNGAGITRWWRPQIGVPMANCVGCGSQWDGRQTAPVGSFPANPFGVFDTAGNVTEWIENCPFASCPVSAGAHGSSWFSAIDAWSAYPARYRGPEVGFRVARTLR